MLKIDLRDLKSFLVFKAFKLLNYQIIKLSNYQIIKLSKCQLFL